MTNSTRTFKGAIHLHTTLSHDGTLTLRGLASFLRNRGYHFLAVTEHSQDMTAESLSALETESEALSDQSLLIIPGIEFSCTATIHILGIGITSLCQSEDPSAVIDHIHDHGGLAVLAHPSNKNYPIEASWVEKLDGCEIWNNGNGKWLPQLREVRKFHDLARVAPGLKAFAALDLHRPQSYSHVATWVRASILDRAHILEALKNGPSRLGGTFLRLNPNGRLGIFRTLYLVVVRTALNVVRRFRG